MLVRIVICSLATTSTLAAMLSPGAAYASGKRQHIPLIHTEARSFQPPDPCRAHCGSVFAGQLPGEGLRSEKGGRFSGTGLGRIAGVGNGLAGKIDKIASNPNGGGGFGNFGGVVHEAGNVVSGSSTAGFGSGFGSLSNRSPGNAGALGNVAGNQSGTGCGSSLGSGLNSGFGNVVACVAQGVGNVAGGGSGAGAPGGIIGTGNVTGPGNLSGGGWGGGSCGGWIGCTGDPLGILGASGGDPIAGTP